jgi:hypothetical protein
LSDDGIFDMIPSRHRLFLPQAAKWYATGTVIGRGISYIMAFRCA